MTVKTVADPAEYRGAAHRAEVISEIQQNHQHGGADRVQGVSDAQHTEITMHAIVETERQHAQHHLSNEMTAAVTNSCFNAV